MQGNHDRRVLRNTHWHFRGTGRRSAVQSALLAGDRPAGRDGQRTTQEPPQMHHILALTSMAFALATGADDALKPWSTNTHPGDVAKSHVEEITTGPHQYTVVQGGTMDGRNCRSPMGCGIAREGALLQTWESNRSVRMENVGETDVVNPWLSNGRNNFRSVARDRRLGRHAGHDRRREGLCAVVPGNPVSPPFRRRQQRTRRPGEGLQRLRLQHLRQRFHLPGHAVAPGRPQGGAGPGAGALHFPGLLRQPLAFLRRRHALRLSLARQRDRGRRTGHRARPRPGQAHPLQGNPLARHLVGRAGHVRDVFLRGAGHGRARRQRRHHDEHGPAPRRGDRLALGATRSGQVPRGVDDHAHLSSTPICNGLWEYRPDFSKETWRKGAASVENITSGPDGLAAEEGKKGTIIWTMRSPYVVCGRPASRRRARTPNSSSPRTARPGRR